MGILRRKEIAHMPIQDLQDKLKDLKTELIRNNAQRATRQNAGKAGEIRKTIAKILTALRKTQIK